MKRQTRTICVVLALIGVLLLTTGSVSARATGSDFTGSSSFLALIDPGTVTFPDGNMHIRGMIMAYDHEATDDRVTGTLTVVINGNWQTDGIGRMWGTTLLDVDYGGGGVWESTWTGTSHVDGSSSIRSVGHGTSGSVAGLKMFVTEQYPADGGPSSGIGSILDPHGE